jgi:hypothetical protein
MPPEVERLHIFGLELQTSRDAYGEADVIRRLREWMTSRGFTYTLRAHRPEGSTPVASPSTSNQRLRAHMQIFRGREMLHEFTFVPRNNRNLATLGQ